MANLLTSKGSTRLRPIRECAPAVQPSIGAIVPSIGAVQPVHWFRTSFRKVTPSSAAVVRRRGKPGRSLSRIVLETTEPAAWAPCTTKTPARQWDAELSTGCPDFSTDQEGRIRPPVHPPRMTATNPRCPGGSSPTLAGAHRLFTLDGRSPHLRAHCYQLPFTFQHRCEGWT
jgi:hypothetical protein